MDIIDIEVERIDDAILDLMSVTSDHFVHVLAQTNPSSL